MLVPPAPEKDKQPSKIEREFEEDWPKFWLKRGKESAFRAYQKARKRASREEIMAGVVRMGPVLLREAQEGDRTPLHPATWLNRGGWLDEIEPQKNLLNSYPVRDIPRDFALVDTRTDDEIFLR